MTFLANTYEFSLDFDSYCPKFELMNNFFYYLRVVKKKYTAYKENKFENAVPPRSYEVKSSSIHDCEN